MWKSCECKREKEGDSEEIRLGKLRRMRVENVDNKGGGEDEGERCDRVVSARERKEIQKR